MARFKGTAAKLKGPFRALAEKLRHVVSDVEPQRAPTVSAAKVTPASDPPEVFYRAMSRSELRGLTETGGLSVRGESFVTQDLSYVRQLAERHPGKYEVTVRFETEPGTKAALLVVGARSTGRLLSQEGLDHLPLVARGMTHVVHVKAESRSINYGLRPGSAALFNSRIRKFGVHDG